MSDRIAFTGTTTVEGRRIKGSVQLAGQRTFRNNEWVEVDPAALVKADATDVFARVDHDPARVLARTKNGTLSILRTDQGFEYETAELPNTSYANDALELARGGYFGGSSFEIEIARNGTKFDTDPDTGARIRRITSIKRLVDVSPVLDPAFASTAAAFSKEGDPVSTEVNAPAEQEQPAPEPQPEPKTAKAKFSQTSETDWAGIAAQASDEHLSATADALFAKGSLQGYEREQYTAFVAEIQNRKSQTAQNEARFALDRARHDAIMGRLPKAPDNAELFASDDYTHAFGQYLRGKHSAMEQFAQAITGDGTQGGYTVPESFRQKIVETQSAFGGIQQHADVIETSDGRALPWPTNDDTGNSAAVASEGSAPASGGADLVFGEISLGAFSIAATGTGNAPLKVSWELLQDSMFNLEDFIARKLGERLGRKAAALYANGVGTTEPFGLLAKTPDAMTATTLYAALVEHMFQVNEAYRSSGNCRWIMSDSTLTKVYGSVDLNGRPLFQPAGEAGGQSGPAGMLLGYPVTLDQAASTNVAFGDIAQGFVIRRVRDIQVVVDPYNNTAARQNAYHAWMRTDSAIQDSAAVSVSSYSSVSADAVGS